MDGRKTIKLHIKESVRFPLMSEERRIQNGLRNQWPRGDGLCEGLDASVEIAGKRALSQVRDCAYRCEAKIVFRFVGAGRGWATAAIGWAKQCADRLRSPRDCGSGRDSRVKKGPGERLSDAGSAPLDRPNHEPNFTWTAPERTPRDPPGGFLVAAWHMSICITRLDLNCSDQQIWPEAGPAF